MGPAEQACPASLYFKRSITTWADDLMLNLASPCHTWLMPTRSSSRRISGDSRVLRLCVGGRRRAVGGRPAAVGAGL